MVAHGSSAAFTAGITNLRTKAADELCDGFGRATGERSASRAGSAARSCGPPGALVATPRSCACRLLVEVNTEPHQIFVDEEGIFGEAGVAEWMAFIRDSEGNLVGLASRHAGGASR